MMKQIKIGAKVRVREDLVVGREYNGTYFVSNMEECKGKEYEVLRTGNGRRNVVYTLKDIERWVWDMSMLEVKEEDIEEIPTIICDDCGCEIEECDAYEVENGTRMVCESCYQEYSECGDCGELHYHDDMRWSDYDECYYCSDCCNSRPQHRILDYHEFSDWELFKASDEVEPPFYIGHELEVENYDNDSSCIDYLYDNLNVVLAHDGSLDRGYEIISHPQSFKWYMEHKEDYKNALNKLKDNGYRSHDTSTCGLHFHVTRPYIKEIRKYDHWNMTEEEREQRSHYIELQNDVIDRIILLMETYKEELIKFSRREGNQLKHWAQFLSDYRGKDDINSLYYIKKNKEVSTRYMALNLENSNTIEFRIFKGTLNYETFMASIELVNNIVTLASDLDRDITTINWKDLTSGEFVKQYCIDKNIQTDKKVLDNSKLEILREQRIKKDLYKINNILVDFYNLEVKRMFIENKPLKKNSIEKNREIYANIYASNATRIGRLSDKIRDILFVVQQLDVDRVKNDIRAFISYYSETFEKEEYKDIKTKLERYI